MVPKKLYRNTLIEQYNLSSTQGTLGLDRQILKISLASNCRPRNQVKNDWEQGRDRSIVWWSKELLTT